MCSKLLLAALSLLLSILLFGKVESIISNGQQFEDSEVITIVDAVGPESFAFDPFTDEGPYTGVSDGRIIKLSQSKLSWIDFAVTTPNRDGCEGQGDHVMTENRCGRPLGLRFSKRTGDLYIADAYMGLLVVGPNGGLATTLTTQAQDIPFKFTNALDIDETNGVVYFTDSSSVYQRRNHDFIVTNEDKTGRFLKYDLNSKQTTVVLKNLSFPNGVALSKNGDFVLIAETSTCRILRLWLEPSEKAGRVEEFAQLPGYPDNIKMNDKGEFWVAMYSRRIIGIFSERIGNGFVKLSINETELLGSGLAVRLSEDGEILETLEDKFGKVWKFASEVDERNENLWIGSVEMPFAVKLQITHCN